MSDVLSRLTSARSFLDKKVNFRGEKTGTTIYQRSINYRVICDRVIKASQCKKFEDNWQKMSEIEHGNQFSTQVKGYIYVLILRILPIYNP